MARSGKQRVTGWLAAGAVAALAGCGGSGKPPVDARRPTEGGTTGDSGPTSIQRQLLSVPTDVRGVAVLGPKGQQTELLVIDSRTQRPVEGGLVQALAEKDGYLVRVSKDADAVEPTVAFVRSAQRVTVPVGPTTPDVQAHAVRGRVRISDQQVLATDADLAAVALIAENENRATVIFLPAPGETEADPRFAVYRSMLPGTLLAVSTRGGPPGDTAPETGRTVSATGARRAGLRVDEPLLRQSAAATMDDRTPPAIASLAVTSPDDQGAATLSWKLDDPDRRVQALQVGVDTTQPDRRIRADDGGYAFSVARGGHFACVRPSFTGVELEGQLSCISFDAPQAPSAANVRVRVTAMPMDAAPAARRPIPVEVEVENVGDAPAASFDLGVVLSRDGSLEAGLGELRLLPVDNLGPGQKVVRQAYITPPHDGAFYVTAKADVAGQLRESNPRDNLARAPVQVMPAPGATRVPVVSFLGSASTPTAVPAGQTLKLAARAIAMAEGDISARIGWISSLDGELGTGPKLSSPKLSPGVHRISIRVAGGNGAALPRPERAALPAARPGGRKLQAPAGDSVLAETTVEIVDPMAPTNSPPSVSAGPDLRTLVGVMASPVATASDPDGDPISYRWTATDPTGAPAELGAATTLLPTLTPSMAGAYRLVLTVSDGKTSAADSVDVVVLSPAEDRPPQVTLTLPAGGQVGAPLAAQVVASDEDMDPLTFGFHLEAPAGSQTHLVDAQTSTPSFVPDLPGRYRLVVTADDGRGGRSTAGASATITDTATDAGPSPGRVLGAACASASDCASGLCEQGVCCSSPCRGACVSCGLAGREGTCSGMPSGTSCAAGQCQGGSFVPARTCDGNGQCGGTATRACAPYACNTSGCVTSCAGDGDCAAPAVCRMGACVTAAGPDAATTADAPVADAPVADGGAPDAPPGALGAACTGAADCTSGFCAQGVCCNFACTSNCESCALPGTVGSCTWVPFGQDPLDQCPTDPSASCGRDGFCNGSGLCHLYAAGTTCGASSCAGTVFSQAAACDGAGACRPGATIACAGSCTPAGCSVPDGGTTPDAARSCASGCPAGSICCGSVCVSPNLDPGNCGGCGLACTGGKVCQGGGCVCDSMHRDCGGTCRSLLDPDNCGGCGTVCPVGSRFCNGSGCQPCSTVQRTECGGQCVDPGSDPANCGSCGNPCPANHTCVSGSCVAGTCTQTCVPGAVCCDAAAGPVCTDLHNDASNCGACGVACSGGKSCQGGVCACDSMSLDCGGECTPIQIDADNCGSCGKVCAPGNRLCSGGTCQPCSSVGLAECGGRCVDVASDPANCGDCTVACQGGETCVSGGCTAGACGTTCPQGDICCGSPSAPFCTDPASDSANCGSCGQACTGGRSCQGGKCACNNMQNDCGGICRSIFDADNCGDCGVVCPADQRLCTGGPPPTCQPCSTFNLTDCNGTCVDTAHDQANCGSCAKPCGLNQACVGSVCVTGQAQ